MSACRAHWARGRLSVQRGLVGLIVAWVLVYTPSLAVACSVCSAGRDEENASAFLLSTLFMSLLPLIAIGAIVYGLWWRIRKFEAEKEALAEERASGSARVAVSN